MIRVTRFFVPAAALTLVIAVAAPVGALASYGRTGAPDGRLRDGCHNYRYTYRVNTPTNDWALETFLIGPQGVRLASGAFLADADPRRGRPTFRFCRYATHPGRFTIKARISWYDAYNQEHKGKLEPTHFRLRRP